MANLSSVITQTVVRVQVALTSSPLQILVHLGEQQVFSL
jgi:hypothetical protein